ncbi:MAG: formimidoylglutamase [Lutibacter sp.]
MNFDFLKPVDKTVLAVAKMQQNQSLVDQVIVYTKKDNFPDLSSVKLAIVSIDEDRAAVGNHGTGSNFDEVRKEFYQLFPGNWMHKIADLGTIVKGNTLSDTYFAVGELLAFLLKKNIIPIIIGGSQDLTYANYRAYDQLEQTVNLVSVDNKFDLGQIEDELTAQSYLSKIVMTEPNNLFNFVNIGYQTYFNPQHEIDLINNLFFEAYRLGELKQDIKVVEPILRDADMVSIDLSSVKNADAPANQNAQPNGLDGVDICTIARYAGISDKVTSFGIYEYNPKFDQKNCTSKLMAQIIWYFIEGVNYRSNDFPFGLMDKYQKFIVPIKEKTLNFYKSNKSGRWWMEINIATNNKFKRHALIPCTYQDYISATNQEIPDRWLKTLKKIV